MLVVGRKWVADCHLHLLRGGANGVLWAWLVWGFFV